MSVEAPLCFYRHPAIDSWQLLFFRGRVIVRGARAARSHWRCLDWFWSGVEIFRHFDGALLSDLFYVAFDLFGLDLIRDLLSRLLIGRLPRAPLFELEDV